MKQNVMPSIVQMDADTLKRLTTEVRETLATDFEMTARKKDLLQLTFGKYIRVKNGQHVSPENGLFNI